MIQETEVLQGIQARGFLITQSRLLCTITAVLYQTAFTNREQAKMMFRSECHSTSFVCQASATRLQGSQCIIRPSSSLQPVIDSVPSKIMYFVFKTKNLHIMPVSNNLF